jgi:hypothetical protein
VSCSYDEAQVGEKIISQMMYTDEEPYFASLYGQASPDMTVGSAGGRNGTSNVRTIVFQTTKWRNTYVSCSYTQREARVWAACARSSDQVKALAEWSLR